VPGRFLEVGGERVHLVERGAGPPLLLIHGYPSNATSWRPVAERLAGSFATLAPDMVGFGLSTRHPRGPLDGGAYADRLAALLDTLEIPRAHVAGLSWGGSVAQRLAVRHPDRVQRLVTERERVSAELVRTDGVTVYPSGANFLLFRPAGDGHERWQEMVDQGVLVRDFSRWPRLEGCLRVTIGTPEENDAFVAALRSSLQEVAV